MKNVREPIWWLPLLRRMLVWGSIVALSIGVIVLVLKTALFSAFVYSGPLFPPDPGMTIMVREPTPLLSVVAASLQGTWLYCFFGFLFAGIIGFYAPTTESNNPLESHFFRSTVLSALQLGFWCWLALYFVSMIVRGALISAGIAYIALPLAIVPIAFGVGLFLVLHRTTQSAKLK